VPASRVWYVPNFLSNGRQPAPFADLPGTPGSRIVCVGNLRPEKDHLTLVRAMAQVARTFPHAHLLIVGADNDAGGCGEQVRREIRRNNLTDRVSLLGQRHDVLSILRGCDIGVLSSVSEGFPVALLEYGAAGLATVATHVGQCAEVVDQGRCGLLVPPQSPDKLAEALGAILASADLRAALSSRLHQRIEDFYSPRCIIPQICRAYEFLLNTRR
jgi:glycosyltransferase involved in cell wall biosynthesis